jgi:hypothetical protein
MIMKLKVYFNNKELNMCDVLVRKLILFRLEGTDIYWDGDVIGKRTCLNYYGRVFIYNLANYK